jgi:hypothetical protein
MIKIPFNKNINGDLLAQEFANAGFITDVVVYAGDLVEFNGVDEADTATAIQILDAHIAPVPTEPTVAEKLASVGLSIEELKTELGL